MPGPFTKSSDHSIPISLDDYGHAETPESIDHPLLSTHHSKHLSPSVSPLLSEPLGRLNTLINPARRRKWLRIQWILLAVVLLGLLLGLFELHRSGLASSFLSSTSSAQNPDMVMDPLKFPEKLAKSKTICSYCDCQANRTSPPLLNYPNPSKSSSQPTRSSMLNHVWMSIRDIYCQHAWLGEGPALDLLEQTDIKTDIQSHIQWRLDLIKPSIPTAYIYTKTSWVGRTKHLRYAYFKRHILTIKTHLAIMRNTPWPEGEGYQPWGKARQLVWIIIEDGEKLANDVAQEMLNADLSYIYMTYGPTHHYGNAQQNAAYAMIHRLTDPEMGGFLGPGPVMSIDDDSNFLPELLVMIWKTKRIGVWPMGNLGPHGWEGPVYDPANHTLLSWEAGAVKDRKFPVDNGAFAFSSDLLGSVIKGPRYWPTDISGGENEFIKLIIDKKEDLEPLCYNCHVAWHNEPLPPACTDLQICP